jgi:hypothetical protein
MGERRDPKRYGLDTALLGFGEETLVSFPSMGKRIPDENPKSKGPVTLETSERVGDL